MARWQCPYGDPACQGQPAVCPPWQIYKKPLIGGGIALLVIGLFYYLFLFESTEDQLAARLATVEEAAQAHLKDAQRMPTNPGRVPPKSKIWAARIQAKTDAYRTIPSEDEQNNLPALTELESDLRTRIKQATTQGTPTFDLLPPFTIYQERAQENRALQQDLANIVREARREGVKSLAPIQERIETNVRRARKLIAAKSRVPKEQPPALDKLQNTYQESLRAAYERTQGALDAARRREQERQAQLQRQLEEQKRWEATRSAAEKERKWQEATPALTVQAPASLQDALLRPLIIRYLEKSSPTGSIELLTKENRRRFRKGFLSLELTDSPEAPVGATTELARLLLSDTTSRLAEGARIFALDALVFALPVQSGRRSVPLPALETFLQESTPAPLDNGELLEALTAPAPGSPGHHVCSHFLTNYTFANQSGSSVPVYATAYSAVRNRATLGLIQSGSGAEPVWPTSSNIAAEQYYYSLRLALAPAPGTPAGPACRAFQNFLLSEEGQQTVSQLGFISTAVSVGPLVEPLPSYIHSAVPDRVVLTGRRLTTTVRFRTGEFGLDERAQDDLPKITRIFGQAPGPRQLYLLVGFADHRGTPQDNLQLSQQRTRTVAQQLRSQGLTHTPRLHWEGENFPITQETSERDLALNRRVEAWLLHLQ